MNRHIVRKTNIRYFVGLAVVCGLTAMFMMFPASGWAKGGYQLVAPKTEVEVNLPEDIGPFTTESKVAFDVKGWWSLDIEAEINVPDLQDLFKQAVKLHGRPLDDPKGYSIFDEITRLKRSIKKVKWHDVFNLNKDRSNITPVEVPIPEPGGMKDRVRDFCYTEKELEQSWKKIRQWYFDEADRIVNEGL